MFSDPLKNLKAIPLKEDDVVADMGAGTGYYSIAAGTLSPRGKVYAIEIEKDYLETIKIKVRDAHLSNVEIISGDVEKLGGTKINDHVATVVVVSNILFQVEKKDIFLKEVKRVLRPKGKVLLVDWSPNSFIHKKAVIPKNEARAMFEENGFVFEREINAGEHHYGMILNKNI